MKVRPDDPAKLSDFKVLAFDCFGTLVDWESGIYKCLEPLRNRLPDAHPLKHDRAGLIRAFDKDEVTLLPLRPALHYPTLLARAYTGLHHRLLPLSSPSPSNSFPQTSASPVPVPPTSASPSASPEQIQSEANALGASISSWAAFPDTVQALHTLAKHYHLAILSNVDRGSFDAVLAPEGGALHGVPFTGGVYTAGEIGAYKPDLANFDYLLDKCAALPDGGVKREEALMVAHGLRSDHVPAMEKGMKSVWIARGESVDGVLSAVGAGPGAEGAGAGEGEGGDKEGGEEEGGMDGSLADVRGKVGFTWVFDSMGEMAAAVEGDGD